MTKEDIEIYLKERGWSQWYSYAYWVHPKTVSHKSTQDYTDYGMDLISAYLNEKHNLTSFRNDLGMPVLNKTFTVIPNIEEIAEEYNQIEKEIN